MKITEEKILEWIMYEDWLWREKKRVQIYFFLFLYRIVPSLDHRERVYIVLCLRVRKTTFGNCQRAFFMSFFCCYRCCHYHWLQFSIFPHSSLFRSLSWAEQSLFIQFLGQHTEIDELWPFVKLTLRKVLLMMMLLLLDGMKKFKYSGHLALSTSSS